MRAILFLLIFTGCGDIACAVGIACPEPEPRTCNTTELEAPGNYTPDTLAITVEVCVP